MELAYTCQPKELLKKKNTALPLPTGWVIASMGKQLSLQRSKSLVWSGVGFGTMQLLPNGKMIILMADHQTTGGYPRIGNIVTAHLPLLAQLNPHDRIKFALTEVEQAATQWLHLNDYLITLQQGSSLKLATIL